EIISSANRCAAVSLAEDGQAIYLRKTDGNLEKDTLDGKTIWSVSADLDAMPNPPVEKDGIVYVCSRLGLLLAIRASDGVKVWQYQAAPQLYVYGGITVHDGVVYVTGSDGSVTAVSAH
ncbi:MAG TPA: PQQ-binding-like beta-propeller repeat protein, partial [Armatimonadota bacterium]|nr:PQQ-binding-like beta-propeller repeat protein [Armatimonadota bacterium]